MCRVCWKTQVTSCWHSTQACGSGLCATDVMVMSSAVTAGHMSEWRMSNEVVVSQALWFVPRRAGLRHRCRQESVSGYQTPDQMIACDVSVTPGGGHGRGRGDFNIQSYARAFPFCHCWKCARCRRFQYSIIRSRVSSLSLLEVCTVQWPGIYF
jgi:hypothetical protein